MKFQRPDKIVWIKVEKGPELWYRIDNGLWLRRYLPTVQELMKDLGVRREDMVVPARAE